jgi:putative addiction module antidote
MAALKLIAIGNSTGVILPKEVLARLKLDRGDSVFLSECPEGYTIRPHDAEFERQMAVARKIAKKDRAVLRELAK